MSPQRFCPIAPVYYHYRKTALYLPHLFNASMITHDPSLPLTKNPSNIQPYACTHRHGGGWLRWVRYSNGCKGFPLAACTRVNRERKREPKRAYMLFTRSSGPAWRSATCGGMPANENEYRYPAGKISNESYDFKCPFFL